MAGRGCTITIKLLGSLGPGSVEDISLPVALHSPLIVLKQELAEFVAIRPADQVLILCDLSDPDRNSDVLLTGRDDFTLSECGVRNGKNMQNLLCESIGELFLLLLNIAISWELHGFLDINALCAYIYLFVIQ